MEAALQRGWDAYSFDTSERITEHARERIGSARALISIEGLPKGSFDVVTLWCVVAHTTDATPLLRSASRHLREGGMLWLSTPNFRFEKLKSALAAVAGRSIDFWAADHVGHFMPATLERTLGDHGLTEVRGCFCGITETCMASGHRGRLGVELKRAFNASAYAVSRLGLPTFASELQITAFKTGS